MCFECGDVFDEVLFVMFELWLMFVIVLGLYELFGENVLIECLLCGFV